MCIRDSTNATTYSSNASNLSGGTVGTARLGSGTANSTTILYGNSVWATPAASSTNTAAAFAWTNTHTFGGSPPTAGQVGIVGASNGVSLALSDNVNNSLYVKHIAGAAATLGTDAGGQLAFAANGFTEAVRITSAGNFGIGNTAPTDKLSVNGTTYLGGLTTHTANIAMANNYVTAPALKAYSEFLSTNAASTGATTLDLSTSNFFNLTLTGNVTFTFSNAPSGRVFAFTIVAKQDATGGRTITWPVAKIYAGGVAPPATTTANALDIWNILTYDAGTSYIVSLSVKDAK